MSTRRDSSRPRAAGESTEQLVPRANRVANGLETRVWLRMLACANLIEGSLREHLRDGFGITMARFDVLAQLDRPPASPTMSELSQRLMVTKGNITDVVGRLEAEELVERRRDPTDARVQRVHLTAKGRRLVAAAVPAHNEWLAALMRDFDQNDLEEFDALLGKLRAVLRRGRTT